MNLGLRAQMSYRPSIVYYALCLAIALGLSFAFHRYFAIHHFGDGSSDLILLSVIGSMKYALPLPLILWAFAIASGFSQQSVQSLIKHALFGVVGIAILCSISTFYLVAYD